MRAQMRLNDLIDRDRNKEAFERKAYEYQKEHCSKGAPVNTPPTINELKSNGSSEALRPRLQIRSVRKKRRIEPDCGRRGSTIGARRSNKLKSKSPRAERAAAVIFFDTLATIVCIQNLEQGFIDRFRSNSIRLVFGEKIESN